VGCHSFALVPPVSWIWRGQGLGVGVHQQQQQQQGQHNVQPTPLITPPT
jgi:hypothetical protein